MNIVTMRRGAGDKREPARDALAAAISAHAKAEADVGAQTATIERANALVAECESKLDAARLAVVAARNRQAQQIADAVSAGTAVSGSSAMRQARAAERDVEDELAAAQEALVGKLEADLADLGDQVRQRKNEVLVARAVVVGPYLANMLALAWKLRRELRVAECILLELLNRDPPDAPHFPPDQIVAHLRAVECRQAVLADLRAEAERFFIAGRDGAEDAACDSALRAMRTAMTLLATDADAELPALP
jgi:hypothetical protein